MKKLLSLLMICILLLGSVLPLSAAKDDVTVVLDGNVLAFDVPGQIIDGRTMVPLRKIFEAMGATVNYNAATKTAVATKGDTTVSLTIGEPKIVINGLEKALDVPGLIVDGRTLAPLRAVGEAFGGLVTWDGKTRTATIETVPPLAPIDKYSAFEQSDVYQMVYAMVMDHLTEMNPVFAYKNTASVHHLTLYLTAPDGFAAALKEEPLTHQESWNEITGDLLEMSTVFHQSFVEEGYEVDMSMVLLNDADPDKMLLATLNDTVFYNIMDELLA